MGRAEPEVTRRRLYLETMQQVLADSVKVYDSSNGRNILNLPLDRFAAPTGTLQAGSGVLLQAVPDDARAKREIAR